MPTYEFVCKRSHHFERVLPVAQYDSKQDCDCGASARRIISLPAKGYVQRECHYTSPVDDRPITSWAQRREDLARNNCREYDPGMKQDTDRNVQRSQEALEKAVDATVEEQIEKMPSRKREALEKELSSGAAAEITRSTVTV